MPDSEGLLTKAWVASKASLSASCISREGTRYNLMDCAIETDKIKNLPDYMATYNKLRGNLGENVNPENKDINEAMKCFVVPVVLPTGEQVDVIVNSNGQDMACVFQSEEGKYEFTLTPRMKNEIGKNVPKEALEKIIGEEAVNKSMEDLEPENLQEFYEKVKDGDLVPSAKEASKEILKNNGKEVEGDSPEETKSEEEKENDVPEEVRDEISTLCSNNGYDIGKLREVMLVDPNTLDENLPDAGIDPNNGPVYCLRFQDAQLNDRIVMVQPGKTPVDSREYDAYMNDYMTEHRGENLENAVEDEHDKIVYTDLDGNTTVSEIKKEPRDLECSKKEEIQKEMKKLDEATEIIINSDMSAEEKGREFEKINNKRINIFEEYGIEVPEVENAIQEDQEISENMQEGNTEELEEQKDSNIENEDEERTIGGDAYNKLMKNL